MSDFGEMVVRLMKAGWTKEEASYLASKILAASNREFRQTRVLVAEETR